jgi:hypothetical protein
VVTPIAGFLKVSEKKAEEMIKTSELPIKNDTMEQLGL